MPPKNVLILHADQLRYDGLGSSGNGCARTPVLDRLAEEGTRFTRHIASNPICSPSRASLLTGLYPPGHNVWCNGVSLNRREYATLNTFYERVPYVAPQGLCPEPATMADHFAAAGYDTASFGKQHLTPFKAMAELGCPESELTWLEGGMNDWHGPYYGFRHVDWIYGHGEQPCHTGHYARWLHDEHPEAVPVAEADWGPPLIPAVEDLRASPLPFDLHHSAWLADRFRWYLQSGRPEGKPFLAFIGFPDPHHPFTPCAEIVKDFEGADVPDPVDPDNEGLRDTPAARLCQESLNGRVSRDDLRRVIRYTYAMTHQVDLAVGRIIDALKEAGEWDNTVVVFTSDHGDFLGDHDHLRKGFCASDALLRVPLIVRAPGSPLPACVDEPVSNCDVLPTVAALAGIAAPAGVHGADIAQVLREERPHHAFAFSSNGDPASRNYTVYDSTHRLTWYVDSDYVELFDHKSDPGECRNVAHLPENGELVASLKTRIAFAMAEYANPIRGRISTW